MMDDYSKTEPKVITNSVIIAIYGYTLIVPPGPAHSLFFLLNRSTLVDKMKKKVMQKLDIEQ